MRIRFLSRSIRARAQSSVSGSTPSGRRTRRELSAQTYRDECVSQAQSMKLSSATIAHVPVLRGSPRRGQQRHSYRSSASLAADATDRSTDLVTVLGSSAALAVSRGRTPRGTPKSLRSTTEGDASACGVPRIKTRAYTDVAKPRQEDRRRVVPGDRERTDRTRSRRAIESTASRNTSVRSERPDLHLSLKSRKRRTKSGSSAPSTPRR